MRVIHAGQQSIICGDMFAVVPYLEGFHLVLSDPPYDERTHDGARRGGLDAQQIDFEPFDVDTLRRAFVVCAEAGLPSLRWIVSTVDHAHVGALQTEPLRDRSGQTALDFVRVGAWVKFGNAPQFTGDRPAQGHESVVHLHAAGSLSEAWRWNGKGRAGVYVHRPERRTKTPRHPAAKPVALLAELMMLFSDPGEVVLDPFAGDGGVLVAAHLLGREAIGIELDEKWCNVARERLARIEHGDWSKEDKPTRELAALGTPEARYAFLLERGKKIRELLLEEKDE